MKNNKEEAKQILPHQSVSVPPPSDPAPIPTAIGVTSAASKYVSSSANAMREIYTTIF